MNAVEIEEAISNLFEQPFDQKTFPFAFLEAFGNKKLTIDKLKKGDANKSDIEFGILQRNNIHMAVCSRNEVSQMLNKLKNSPTTPKHKAKFLLATDGYELQAEELNTGDTIACKYTDFPNKFAFFLPLAGINTIKQIKENSFDIRATSRLNKLYVELLKNNKDWSTDGRRADMNHFMARLIFCFFAEDTDIFRGENLFIETVNKMSESNSSNTHQIIGELFRSMDTPIKRRSSLGIRSWADAFPYVNGGLFAENTEVPKFSRIARAYLLHIGTLDWRQVNPDIFGSMIQAVTNEEARGELGMHYTSVPNILKLLNPLFLDDLREKLESAGDSQIKLLNLRKRIAKIRLFDPACGSGNFLVIAYKEMRKIEAEINERRRESESRSLIPLTNFRGIELRSFSAEVARLALIIAEYQCNFIYRGQKDALQDFLPLDNKNWIVCGNALRLDWLSICPPNVKAVKHVAEDLFHRPLNQYEIDFENEGGETFICGNPPFIGSRKQTEKQKDELKHVFASHSTNWKNIDYVGAWFWKASIYCLSTKAQFSFVATNSICQGQQVSILWKLIFELGFQIRFAHTSFKWRNLASNNAIVTVIIVGVDNLEDRQRILFYGEVKKEVDFISPYLSEGKTKIVKATHQSICESKQMEYGIYYSKSKRLLLSYNEKEKLLKERLDSDLIKKFTGSGEFIDGKQRFCLWIPNEKLKYALNFKSVKQRIEDVKKERLTTKDTAVQKLANKPHQFREFKGDEQQKIFIPIHSSENRQYIPVGYFTKDELVPNSAFTIFGDVLYPLSLLSSKLHIVWIKTVCGKLETRIRYSNTLGWNTFPVPKLTEKNKEDLTRCAEEILLAREAHFPATIACLYDPEKMPKDLRAAHDHNDEVLERIYIGRRFKNDTERLEKLFKLYTKMTTSNDFTNNKKEA